MKYFTLLFLLFIIGCAHHTQKINDQESLIYWGTKDSDILLKRSIKKDFYDLVNHFETQSNRIYCGPTSATIVLNTLRLNKEIASFDNEILMKKEKRFLPKGFNPSYPKYTQRSVFNFDKKSPKIKTKSKMEVLGAPNLKGNKDFGFQIRQFAEFLKRHQLHVELRVVDEKFPIEQMKKEFIKNLERKDDYILINYKRSELGQEGGGHISPIGAFDPVTQRILIMDVNPNNASWVWVKLETAFKAMKTFDTIENRGYVLIRDTL